MLEKRNAKRSAISSKLYPQWVTLQYNYKNVKCDYSKGSVISSSPITSTPVLSPQTLFPKKDDSGFENTSASEENLLNETKIMKNKVGDMEEKNRENVENNLVQSNRVYESTLKQFLGGRRFGVPFLWPN